VGLLRLLRHRAPLLLWCGQLTSVMGDQLYAMAVLWLVLQLTGSANLMATVSVAESVPYVVVGFVGAGLTLRWDRLRAMMGLDAGRAVLISVIPVTYLLGLHAAALLIAVAALVSRLDALFDPALQAVVPDLVYSLQRNVVVGASAVGAFAVAGLLEATSATIAAAAAGGWMIAAGLLALARTTLSSAARPAR
jgi:hypothetical protein